MLWAEEYVKKTFFVFLLTTALALSAYSQTKEEDIEKLLEITNTKTQAVQMLDLLIPELKSIVPGAPDAFWDMFKEKLDLDNFVDMIIPIYDTHFSHDDINALIRFYETPAGKRLLEVTPSITRESYIAGQTWGEKVARDVVDELIRQGY